MGALTRNTFIRLANISFIEAYQFYFQTHSPTICQCVFSLNPQQSHAQPTLSSVNLPPQTHPPHPQHHSLNPNNITQPTTPQSNEVKRKVNRKVNPLVRQVLGYVVQKYIDVSLLALFILQCVISLYCKPVARSDGAVALLKG